MADRTPSKDLMGYEAMAQEALRGVIRTALERAAGPGGIPGEHHFYITFQTRGAGVTAPDMLAEKYPDEMTIVLQHQFWDLVPGETEFSVVLSFGGQPHKLVIPYAAVVRFYDPSVQFVLQFEGGPDEASASGETGTVKSLPTRSKMPAATSENDSDAEPPPGDDEPPGPKVVSLDQFRKK